MNIQAAESVDKGPSACFKGLSTCHPGLVLGPQLALCPHHMRGGGAGAWGPASAALPPGHGSPALVTQRSSSSSSSEEQEPKQLTHAPCQPLLGEAGRQQGIHGSLTACFCRPVPLRARTCR